MSELEELREDFVFLQRQYNAVVNQNRELQREIIELKNECKNYRKLQDNKSK